MGQNSISFPGQQSGERVFYHAKMSSKMKSLSIVFVVFVAIFFGSLFELFFSFLGNFDQATLLMTLIIVLGFLITLFVIWWINRVYAQTEIFITDRRIVKFLPLVPYRTTARALFWEEAIKVKTYYKNTILEKILGIGSVEVHGRNHEADNIEMDYLTYHEDLGNYIDKILYVYKNKPEELATFKEFIPKPVGMRD